MRVLIQAVVTLNQADYIFPAKYYKSQRQLLHQSLTHSNHLLLETCHSSSKRKYPKIITFFKHHINTTTHTPHHEYWTHHQSHDCIFMLWWLTASKMTKKKEQKTVQPTTQSRLKRIPQYSDSSRHEKQHAYFSYLTILSEIFCCCGKKMNSLVRDRASNAHNLLLEKIVIEKKLVD